MKKLAEKQKARAILYADEEKKLSEPPSRDYESEMHEDWENEVLDNVEIQFQQEAADARL